MLASLVLLALPAASAAAQELDPRSWTYLPVDTNFVGVAVAETEAEIAFDPALDIEDGELEMTTVGVGYLRTFALLGHSARLDILQGWKEGRWSGTLQGAPAVVEREGLADTLVRFSMHLLGAPPLKGADYAAYRAAHPVETSLGVGLMVQLPTGEYLEDKLINIGENRYSFFPQVGLNHTAGPWSFESTALVGLHTDNNDFFNGGTRSQDPVFHLQGHAIYTLPSSLWFSATVAGQTGGESTVNGVAKDDPKDTLFFAAGTGYSIAPWLGLKLSYIGARRQGRTGADSDTMIFSFSTFW
jgi:hypothetical protein